MRHPLLLATIFSLVFVVDASGTAAQVISEPVIPVPSGSYAIGQQAFHLIDSNRPDRFSADRTKRRELMIYIWYPAQDKDKRRSGDYLPNARQLDADPAAQRALLQEFESRWPLIVSGSIKSHAVVNAPPAARAAGFPVVLFSHGVASTTFAYTTQIEDLVSHGYVVVAIEHTDVAAAVLFPNGDIRVFRRPALRSSGDPFQEMITVESEENEMGAEDVRFVLDTLELRKLALVKVMDFRRVAAVGHSFGGTLSARACQLDTRIKACLSEDGEVNPIGAFMNYPNQPPITVPFALVEIDRPSPTDAELADMRESRAQWNGYLAHKRLQLMSCNAGSYHIMISRPGMVHASFSDEPLLASTSGSQEAFTALANLSLIERIDRAFLDEYLKLKTASVLDRDAPAGVAIEHFEK